MFADLPESDVHSDACTCGPNWVALQEWGFDAYDDHLHLKTMHSESGTSMVLITNMSPTTPSAIDLNHRRLTPPNVLGRMQGVLQHQLPIVACDVGVSHPQSMHTDKFVRLTAVMLRCKCLDSIGILILPNK